MPNLSRLFRGFSRYWRIWMPAVLLGIAAVAWHWYSLRPLREAARAAEEGRWIEAGAIAKSYLGDHPGDRKATVLVARCHAALGQVEEAERIFSTIPKLSVEELTWRGEALLRARWWARATPVYEQIVQAEPNNWTAVKHLAALLLKEARSEESLQLADRVIAQPDHAAAGHFLSGLVHYHQGRPEQTIQHFEKVLELDPTAASLPPGNTASSVRLLLAEAMLNLAQVDAAKQHLAEVIRVEPNSARALALLGRAHMDLGDAEVARRYWARSLAIEPDQCDLKQRVAQFEMQQGNIAKALEMLTELEKRCPPTVALHHALGLAYSASGDRESAKVHFDEAARLRAEDEQRQKVERFVRSEPTRAETKLIIARRAIDNGDYLQAETLLLQVLDQQPNHVAAEQLLAEVRVKRAREPVPSRP